MADSVISANFIARVRKPLEVLVRNYPNLTIEVVEKIGERDLIVRVSYNHQEKVQLDEAAKLLARIDEFDGEFVRENWFTKLAKSQS